MTRTLILGGTGWLGRELAAQLVARGDHVSCLARGLSGEIPEGATLIAADRQEHGAYDMALQLDWDEIIELSYEPGFVGEALTALADRTQHWTLVSSVSVYARNDQIGADEEAAVVEPTDLSDYAHAKVAAERVTSDAVGDRLLIARPGLIVGQGDPSDRFGYWVSRLALAATEPVLIPRGDQLSVQAIDVRDIAQWIIRAGLSGVVDVVNVVGSERAFTEVLRAAEAIADYRGELIGADDQWLLAHGVNYWAGPRSLPRWLPPSDRAFAQRSSARFLAHGGEERSLAQTLHDSLADERHRGLDRPRRAGLSREEELILVSELTA